MRGGFFGLVLGVCLTCAAHAEPLTPKAFTDEFVRVPLPRRWRRAASRVRGDLDLIVKRADGSELTMSLANAYQDYLRDPARLETKSYRPM